MADVAFREGAEAGGGGCGEREVDFILAGIVGAGLRGCAAKILPGDDGRAIQNVVDLLALARVAASD